MVRHEHSVPAAASLNHYETCGLTNLISARRLPLTNRLPGTLHDARALPDQKPDVGLLGDPSSEDGADQSRPAIYAGSQASVPISAGTEISISSRSSEVAVS